MIDFILLSLAVWRLSSLLAREEGPFDIFIKICLRLGVVINEYGTEVATGNISKGVLCIWCNSVWFSAVLSIPVSRNIFVYVVNTLALSTMAIIIDKVVTYGND